MGQSHRYQDYIACKVRLRELAGDTKSVTFTYNIQYKTLDRTGMWEASMRT